jgi:hypothetical protein
VFLLKQPSNHRDWSPDQAVLPYAALDGSRATVFNIRHCSYATTSDYTVRHYDRTFDLDRLRSLDYVVEPFAHWRGPAHAFVSFGFEGDQYVAISAEIRRVRGQTYSPLKGMLRTYEIMYVIGDERDLIGLRANVRNDEVFVYPLRARPEGARAVFVSMLRRANRLRERPEFYNTLTNNCLTNIWRHVNAVARRKVPFSARLLLPGYSDRLAYDLGWIDTRLSFDLARQRFRINERARRHADSPDFSARIREFPPE